VKFLLDVCVSSRALTSFLLAQGHDILSALSIDPRASDERLLEFALTDGRVLLTEDKYFGELVFVQRLPHWP
jgi:predicted nuclease of predicted toxin-antitoxin system